MFSMFSPMSYIYSNPYSSVPNPEPAAVPKNPSDDSQTIEKIIEKLYDMHADPNVDRKELSRLLELYKKSTGKEKPLFMA